MMINEKKRKKRTTMARRQKKKQESKGQGREEVEVKRIKENTFAYDTQYE